MISHYWIILNRMELINMGIKLEAGEHMIACNSTNRFKDSHDEGQDLLKKSMPARNRMNSAESLQRVCRKRRNENFYNKVCLCHGCEFITSFDSCKISRPYSWTLGNWSEDSGYKSKNRMDR